MSEQHNEQLCQVEPNAEALDLCDFATPEKQEARAFLRDRFLRFITGIIGEPVIITLYENSKIIGNFRGCDVDCLNIFVRNFETSLGIIPEVMLRSVDVIDIHLKSITTNHSDTTRNPQESNITS